MSKMTFSYDIGFPVAPGTGLYSSTDTVTITVKSGDPRGEPVKFAEFMRKALRDWYDDCRVTLEEPDHE